MLPPHAPRTGGLSTLDELVALFAIKEVDGEPRVAGLDWYVSVLCHQLSVRCNAGHSPCGPRVTGWTKNATQT